MHDDVLTGGQREALAVLNSSALLSRFYLSGGTAAALHLGHRLSADFDFFSEGEFEPIEILNALKGPLPLEVRRQPSTRAAR